MNNFITSFFLNNIFSLSPFIKINKPFIIQKSKFSYFFSIFTYIQNDINKFSFLNFNSFLSSPIKYQELISNFTLYTSNMILTNSLELSNCIFFNITAYIDATIDFFSTGDLKINYCSFINCTITKDNGWGYTTGGVLVRKCNLFILYSSCFDQAHSPKTGSLNIRVYDNPNNYININLSLFMNVGKKGECYNQIICGSIFCLYRNINSTNMYYGRSFWVEKTTGQTDLMFINSYNKISSIGGHSFGCNLGGTSAVIKFFSIVNSSTTNLLLSITAGTIYLSDCIFKLYSCSVFFSHTGIVYLNTCYFDKEISLQHCNYFNIFFENKNTIIISQVNTFLCGLNTNNEFFTENLIKNSFMPILIQLLI